MKMLKLLQELRGFSEMARLHPGPKPSELYVMQLRNHRAEARPKRRLAISIDLQDVVTLPTPVTITYLTPPVAVENGA